jgi:N6-L-threonylcarbamoyladenine synthase
MLVLGIESSCDETAAAVVENGTKVISNEVVSQIDIHTLYGGVVPEIASRCHVEAISSLVRKALEPVGGIQNIDAVAVTYAPGLIGALLVGVNFGKSLAFAAGKPLVPVHHLRGHIAANYLTDPTLTPPFTALVVSGGHSHIVNVGNHTTFTVVGKTRDDAAGESFDKVARVIGLGYPGGPKVEKAAATGNPSAIRFPRTHFADNEFDFSFSGIKTAVINYVHHANQTGERVNEADVACSFQHAATDILVKKAIEAAKEYSLDTVTVGGGVAANGYMRENLGNACAKCGLKLVLPEKILCTDNAAMIGAEGYVQYLKGNFADLTLNAAARVDLG